MADQLSHVQNPVLVLHGDQDHVLPLADSQELARLLPNGRLDVLSNTGHCPNLQDPYGLWLRLSQFLQF
ncbi:MAG: alpha/beta fold hydrolase [Phycisphaerae bacterium]|nr:alpha/beta fold hydrolase [Phycisphaerae bacterium]